MSANAVQKAVDELVAQPPGTGQTLAVVAMVDGRVVAEAYGPDTSADTTLISWSMAKSVTHALIGCLVDDGRLDPSGQAPVASWADDQRSAITLQHLLTMTSGLRFVEDYVDAGISDCIEMLFGSGTGDVAGYATSLPIEHAPGSTFNYSSGTTNILSRIAGQLVGHGPEGVGAYLRSRIFDPCSMESAVPRFDAAGTFIGSSFLFATARDFARFGELYRCRGEVGSQRVLSATWVDHATTRTEVSGDEAYGAHWWLWPAYGGFGAHGYEGQRTIVVPSLGLTLVRLGKTDERDCPQLHEFLKHIIDAAR